ncbi:MAG: CpsD/CapB family tyrosine-protein kinase, partial [Ignavibacteriae bacterium]|nr:CpsD/CapB family tyrosine-protein kinase [Ignavibacteriota bacterium]
SNENFLSAVKILIRSKNSSELFFLNSTIEQIGNSNFESTDFQKQYIQNINEAVEIISDEATTSIGIKVVAQNANESAEIANAVVDAFAEHAIPNSKKTYLSALRSLENRKKDNLSSIQRNSNNLREYTSTASLKSLNPDDEVLVDKISELEAELESVEMESNFLISHLAYLESNFNETFSELSSQLSSINDPNLNQAKLRFERAKTENIIKLSTEKVSGLDIKYPWEKDINNGNSELLSKEVKKIVISIIEKDFTNSPKNNLLKNLVWKIEETKSNINAIDYSKSIIYDLLTNFEDKFITIPIRYIELARLVRTKKFNTKLDFKIKAKENNLKKNGGSYLAEIDSINKAIIPMTHFSPKTTLNIIIGLLGGFLLGIIFSLFSSSETKDNIATAEDLERAGFKVISQVPHYSNGSSSMFKLRTKSDISVEENRLIKSFQNIDAYLKYGNLEKEIKSVLVSSSVEQEGKTLVAANIAASIASEESKVLLIDANFRHPHLDKFFNVSVSPSLPHYLFKKKSFDEIIKPTSVKNLSLITCVELTQNPAVIMKSDRMHDFMIKVKNEFDYIVYDSSSMCILKETVEIAKNVDEVIIVARANKTQLPQLKKTELILKESGINNFDVVLNDAEF